MSGELDQSSSAGISSYSSNYGSARRYDDKPREEPVYNETSVPKFEVPGAPQPLYPRWNTSSRTIEQSTTRIEPG